MEAVIPVVMFALFVGMAALFVGLALRQARRARENLGRLAAQVGLTLPEPAKGWAGRFTPPAVNGVVRGRNLRLYNYTTGSGKSRTTWCALTLGVRNPGGLTLKISRENLLTRAGRMFGVDDVATGDALFDKEFYVKSNDAAYVQVAMLPEVRNQIADAWRRHGARGTFQVNGHEITYAETGTFGSRKICARWPVMIEVAFLLADVVEARGAKTLS